MSAELAELMPLLLGCGSKFYFSLPERERKRGEKGVGGWVFEEILLITHFSPFLGCVV